MIIKHQLYPNGTRHTVIPSNRPSQAEWLAQYNRPLRYYHTIIPIVGYNLPTGSQDEVEDLENKNSILKP